MYYEDSAIRRAVLVGFALRTRSHSPLDEKCGKVANFALRNVLSTDLFYESLVNGRSAGGL